MSNITVRILKNGKIFVETHGMHGKECVPYVQAMCEALDSVPLDLPESPQPVFHFSDREISPTYYETENLTDQKDYLYLSDVLN